MKGKGKRLLCLALACLLCWTVPAQALAVANLTENTEQTEAASLETAQLQGAKQSEVSNTVSDSDILADTVTPLTMDGSAEELVVIEDTDGMVYQAGGVRNSCLGRVWHCCICTG